MQIREFITRQPKTEAIKDQKGVKLDNLNLIGRFSSEVTSTHPKYRYEDKGTKEPYIVKMGPPHCIRADFVGSRVFDLLDLSPIGTDLDIEPKTGKPALIMPDISGNFITLNAASGGRISEDELKLGDFLTKPEQREKFKDSILAALLIGDYDRVPWNVMLAKDGSSFVNMDFGACLGSRAQGGFNGFPPHIDQEEIKLVLRHPYGILPDANELYAEVIEVTPGEPLIKDTERLARLAEQMKKTVTDAAIDAIIEEARWPDNETEKGKQQNIATGDSALSELERKLTYERKGSLGYIKTERAIQTYSQIKNEFGYDFAAYFRSALKTRRDDLIEMFGKKLQ